MSSGRGLHGGVSRCYPFFAEFKECLVSVKDMRSSSLGTMIIQRDGRVVQSAMGAALRVEVVSLHQCFVLSILSSDERISSSWRR